MREFKLHTDEEATYPLAPCTFNTLRPVVLARIMGPTSGEKARELAGYWGWDLEIDGHERTLIIDGERHELQRLPTWKAVWAQIAPHVLEGVEPEDVRPTKVCGPEIGRAWLYWRTWGVDKEEMDRLLGVSKVLKEREEDEPDSN